LIIFILYYNVITKSADPKRGAGKKEKKTFFFKKKKKKKKPFDCIRGRWFVDLTIF